MPATGRLTLVPDPRGRLIGRGTPQRDRRDRGAPTRLCVRPEADGHAPCRAIVDTRVDEARATGRETPLAHAIRGNTDMPWIDEPPGFGVTDRYPARSDPTEVDPVFVYMQHEVA